MIKASNRIDNLKEYYFSIKLKEIEQLNSTGPQVINIGIGNPDLPPSVDTIKSLTENTIKDENHGYQKYNGTDELRKAFSLWYKKYFNVKIDPDSEVLPLMGSKEGILHISMAFLNPGDKVLVPDPGYPAYSSVTKMIGAEIVKYDLKEKNFWYPDLDELNNSDLSGVKLMWINYPNMPTGAPASKEVYEKLIEFGKQNNILICNDNPYSFILNNNPISILSVQGSKDIALELNSLSKSHNMAGWRIGVVMGNKNFIKNIITIKSNIDSGMFLPVQLAGAEALTSSEEWFKELNILYLQRRKIVWEILDSLKATYNKKQNGMFIWAKIPENYNNAVNLSDYILNKARVFLTPGSVFGENGEKYIRISLCTNETKLIEAKNRILKHMIN
ncbi:pyridoxal phosphate-dependent aminotransferase [Bacteroidota bacterium]